MTKAYEDQSIFQGQRQWVDANGQTWRAECRTGGLWSVYQKNGQSFVHAGIVKARANASPKTIALALAKQ